MPSQPIISLFHLSSIALHEVFKCMDPCELFNISLISKKSQIRIRILTKKFPFHMFYSRNNLYFGYLNCQLTYLPVPVIEGIDSMMDYFEFKTFSMDYNSPNNHYLLILEKVANWNMKISKLVLTDAIMLNSFEYFEVLKHPIIKLEILANPGPISNFPGFKSDLKSLTLNHAQGVKLEHLQDLKCSHINLSNINLSSTDINSLLKTWLQMTSPFQAYMFNVNEMLNSVEVLKDLNVSMDERLHEYVGGGELATKYFSIQRNDGVRAFGLCSVNSFELRML